MKNLKTLDTTALKAEGYDVLVTIEQLHKYLKDISQELQSRYEQSKAGAQPQAPEANEETKDEAPAAEAPAAIDEQPVGQAE